VRIVLSSVLSRVKLAGRALASGQRVRDKVGIAARISVYALFPVGLAARKLGRQLPDPTGWFGEIRVRCRDGIFVCPPGPGAYFLGADDSYEPELRTLLRELRGGTVVDVGANVGFIAIRAAKTAERVIAIEPHPERFRYLKENVHVNGLRNITLVNCAVGADEGELTLYDVDPTLGPRPLDVSARAGRGSRFQVRMRTLDSLLDDLGVSGVDLVKIDVEGYECEVVRGMPKLLIRRPRLVIEVLGELDPLRDLLPGYSLREIDVNSYLGEPPAA
jgi:FkbM family methyltransferase